MTKIIYREIFLSLNWRFIAFDLLFKLIYFILFNLFNLFNLIKILKIKFNYYLFLIILNIIY